MSIIIPSSKIYKLQNSIIEDNSIKSAEADVLYFTENIEEDTVLYQDEKSYDILTDTFGTKISIRTSTKTVADETRVGYVALAGTSLTAQRYYIDVDKETADYITNNESAFIIVNRDITLIKNIRANLYYSYPSSRPSISDNVTIGDIYVYYGFSDEEKTTFSQSGRYSPTLEVSSKNTSPNGKVAEVNSSVDNPEPLNFDKIDWDAEGSTETKYRIKFSLIRDIKLLKGAFTAYRGDDKLARNDDEGTDIRLEHHQFSNISVLVRGKTFKLKQEREILQKNEGVGNKSLSLKSNSLLQKTRSTEIETHLSSVINNYSDGKETATVLCSIGEYYDENGNKVISTENSDKMTFEIYDEVIPTYNTAYGEAPLSLKDGKPKTFQVLGSKIYFNGAVWQELTLQESGVSEADISNGSKGLAYEEIEGELYCTGIGTCTDTDIKIASFVNGIRNNYIAEKAFRNVSNINSLEIINGISNIGTLAFVGCENLNKILIPESIVNISNNAFAGARNLTKINYNAINANDLPASNRVFYDAGLYTLGIEVVFGNNVKKIPSYLFDVDYTENHPANIVSVKFDKNSVCETIGRSAFSACYNLRYINIPNSVINIFDRAFYKCTSLDSIVIGNSVTSIGKYAFYDCTSLTDVYYKGTEQQWNNINIGGGNESLLNATIHFNS